MKRSGKTAAIVLSLALTAALTGCGGSGSAGDAPAGVSAGGAAGQQGGSTHAAGTDSALT